MIARRITSGRKKRIRRAPYDYINTVAEQDARTEEGDFAVTEELLREESLEIIAVPVDEVHAEINNLREEH